MEDSDEKLKGENYHIKPQPVGDEDSDDAGIPLLSTAVHLQLSDAGRFPASCSGPGTSCGPISRAQEFEIICRFIWKYDIHHARV